MSPRKRSFWALCSPLLFLTVANAGYHPHHKPDSYPSWWFVHDVIPRTTPDTGFPVWPTDFAAPDDFAAANVGQLKHIAHKALDNLADWGFADWELRQTLLDELADSGGNPDNFALANIGQVKHLASKVYAVLPFPEGFDWLPWDFSVGSDDYAVANIGQLKAVFAFEFDGDPICLRVGNFGAFKVSPTERIYRELEAAHAESDVLVADEVVDVATTPKYTYDYRSKILSDTTGGALTRKSSLPSLLQPLPSDPEMWISNPTAPAMVEDCAYIQYSGAGLVHVQPVTVATYGAESSYTHKSYVSGSLIEHIFDEISGMLPASPTATNQRVLNPDGSRNPDLWTNGHVDLSPVVVRATGWGPNGALVTPIHVLIARHVPYQPGDQLSFRNEANTATVTRTVVSTAAIAPPGLESIDIALVTLDAPITYATDGIRCAKMLPATVADKWQRPPSGSQAAREGRKIRRDLPILKFKRNGGDYKLGVALGGFEQLSVSGGMSASRPHPAWIAPWYLEWVSGDSGSVIGTVINGEFVFLGAAWYGQNAMDDGVGDVLHVRESIEALIAPSGYTLQEVDLSGFPSYY